jgi:hypothetical protein
VNATRDLETELAALFDAQARSIPGAVPALPIDRSTAIAPVIRRDDHQRRRGRLLMVAASVLVLAGISATWWAMSNRRGQVARRGNRADPRRVAANSCGVAVDDALTDDVALTDHWCRGVDDDHGTAD